MSDKLKRIFSKDLDEAFKKAREEERALCEKENTEEKEKALRRVENNYILQIKLLEQENESLKRQLKNIHVRDKILDQKEQQIKEARIVQRRLASDLVSLAERKRDYDADIYQEFVKIKQDIINSECEIVGIPEKN
jgi:hypothetical protein